MEQPNKIATKASFSEGFVNFCNRWVPNSMVFAFLLTLLVAILVLIFTDTPLISNSPDGHMSLMNAWVGGFWNLLTFAMQMSLIMITGAVVATSPPVKKLLRRVARVPGSKLGAFALLMLVSWVLYWIHWGVGMMVSIFLGREILAAAREKGYKVHANALISASYCMAIPGVGISQAAPLLGATGGYLKSLVVSDAAKAYVPDVIPMSQSVLSPMNLLLCLVLFLIICTVGWILHPRQEEAIQGIGDTLYAEIRSADNAVTRGKAATPAEWINNSPLLNMIIGIFGLIYVIRLFALSGFMNISINNFNFMLMMLGVILCGTPESFCKGVIAAVNTVWGVIIQFPFYAGIFGMIAYTGFSEVIVNFFMTIATRETFPVITYIYSAILNMAVPSGGSKFAIEAPYLLDVCSRLNIDVGKILCIYTFGDQTTNIIQPFWALPYLAMYKIDFKDILPFTLPICIAALCICSLFFVTVF